MLYSELAALRCESGGTVAGRGGYLCQAFMRFCFPFPVLAPQAQFACRSKCVLGVLPLLAQLFGASLSEQHTCLLDVIAPRSAGYGRLSGAWELASF